MELRKLTKLSMLLALSIVLNLIESVIPFIGGLVPGVKLGLANTVTIFVIYMFGLKEAFFISFTRVFLVGMLRTGLFNLVFFFSLGGALCSVTAMYLSKRFTKLSIVGVSIIGALAHSIGQITVAMIALKSFNLVFYLPILLLFSLPTGIIVGIISRQVLSFYKSLH